MKNIILYKHKDKNIYLYIFDKGVYYLSNNKFLDGNRPVYEDTTLKEYLKIRKITNTKYSWYCGGEMHFWGKSIFDFHGYKISRNKNEYTLINISFKPKKIKFV